MTVSNPGRPRMLLPDWVWALGCWVTGAGYFLLSVAVGTTFFFADIPGRPIEPLAVWGPLVIFTLQAVALGWATRYPLPVFWIVFVLFQCTVLLTIDRALLITPALLFSVFTVTALLPRRRWLTPLSIAVSLDLAVYLLIAYVVEGGLSVLSVIAVVLRVVPLYAFATLAGLFYGSQRARAALETERAEALELAAASTRSAAIAAERTRIAREFHDLAAHHLGSIIVNSKAALNLGDDDSALASSALRSIRDESVLAMNSIREVIGMLREDGDETAGSSAAAPALRDSLAHLADSARAAHQPVEVRVDGDVEGLTPAASLACFRIVQESLSNARKHAPGAAVAVRVARTERSLTITVTNAPTLHPSPDPAGPRRSGYGLVGMGERVTMLGGKLRSAPVPGGGWETRAVVPLESHRVTS
ncbi:sensor histidine kinase [uncultured Microbacterium sp.]|uniref:sensor histidine kinase n=1 Tax=uncultured Microbacterium sp. TaxID=191216 RepID=UPI0035CAED2B